MKHHVVATVNEQKMQVGLWLLIAVFPSDYDPSKGFPAECLARPLATFTDVHEACRERDRLNSQL